MSIRHLLGMLLALFSFSSFAQTTVEYEYQTTQGTWTSGFMASPGAAGAAYFQYMDSIQNKVCKTGNIATVVYAYTGVTADFLYATGTRRTTSNNAACTSPYLNPPTVVNAPIAKRIKVAPVCPAGQTISQTWHIGWSSGPTPTGNEPLTTPPTSFCDGKCIAMIAQVEAAGVDTSASPNGSYEMTADVTYSTTGETCTEQTPQPPVPDPPPPGTGGDGTDDGTGTGGDGTGGDGTGGDPGPGGGDPPADTDGDGIPDSEEVPEGEGGGSGAGTTCTPEQQLLGACTCTVEQQAANACNTGTGSSTCTEAQAIDGLCSCTTPAGAATLCGTGGAGGGTDPVTTDQAKPVCGGPGLPACSVLVDDSRAYDTATYKTAVEVQGKRLDDMVKQNGSFWTTITTYIEKSAEELTGWTWSFSLPSGCSPFAMEGYGFSIDVCRFQPMIHDIMGFLWVLLTIAGLVRLFVWGID